MENRLNLLEDSNKNLKTGFETNNERIGKLETATELQESTPELNNPVPNNSKNDNGGNDNFIKEIEMTFNKVPSYEERLIKSLNELYGNQSLNYESWQNQVQEENNCKVQFLEYNNDRKEFTIMKEGTSSVYMAFITPNEQYESDKCYVVPTIHMRIDNLRDDKYTKYYNLYDVSGDKPLKITKLATTPKALHNEIKNKDKGSITND